ncbi:MAG: hypothetical protein R3302_05670, partial [Sulfurimonadaceae bacterium]|nr:hypothetical protein [Sulfurimonadaceae bacterium]
SSMEKNGTDYFIQYIQYRIEDNILKYRRYNLLADRLYYLEVANSALSNPERRRRFYALLGKRRFGANDNFYDIYTINKEVNIYELMERCEAAKADEENPPVRYEKRDRNLNMYELYMVECKGINYALLNQKNISPIKTFEKNFIVELNDNHTMRIQNMRSDSFKIEHVFNRIGKHFFKSIPAEQLVLNSANEISITVPELLPFDTHVIKNGFDSHKKEVVSLLSSDNPELDKSFFELYILSINFLTHFNDPAFMSLFLNSMERLTTNLTRYPYFRHICNYLEVINCSFQDTSVLHNLHEGEDTLRDNVNYAVEALSEWHTSFHSDNGNELLTNTIDTAAALFHFISTYMPENLPAEAEISALSVTKNLSQPEAVEEFIDFSSESEIQPEDSNVAMNGLENRPKISAEELFKELELDNELLDELSELEDDLNDIDTHDTLVSEMRNALVLFFQGYARMLNTLFEFKGLGDSLLLLSRKLEEFDENADSSMALIMLKSIVSDLMTWKEVVLIAQSAENVHYMDDSFYSNIAQLEILLNNEPAAEDEDMEFFI